MALGGRRGGACGGEPCSRRHRCVARAAFAALLRVGCAFIVNRRLRAIAHVRARAAQRCRCSFLHSANRQLCMSKSMRFLCARPLLGACAYLGYLLGAKSLRRERHSGFACEAAAVTAGAVEPLGASVV